MYKAEPGMNFYDACKTVQRNLPFKDFSYDDLLFNGIAVRVSQNSNIDDLSVIYHLKCKIRNLEAMGD